MLKPILNAFLLLGFASLLQAQPITYTKAGKGPAILFIHGFGGNHGVWKEAAASLKADHTVVCIDLPGSGKSGPPTLKEGKADFEQIATEIAALVRRQKLEPCLIVGHSMGGPIAAMTVLQDRQAFRGIVLVDSYFSPIPEAFASRVVLGLAKDPRAALQGMFGAFCKGKAQETRTVKEALRMKVSVLQAYMLAMTQLPLKGRMENLTLPVVLFHAGPEETDPVKRQEQMKRFGMTDLPDFRIVAFPSAKHWLMWDEPDAFLKELLTFEKNLK